MRMFRIRFAGCCAKYVLACRRVASGCLCVCCMPLSVKRAGLQSHHPGYAMLNVLDKALPIVPPLGHNAHRKLKLSNHKDTCYPTSQKPYQNPSTSSQYLQNQHKPAKTSQTAPLPGG
jgi:hypothetical protein